MEGADKLLSKKELKHKTRRLSIKEGIFWSIRASLADQYISPFAILSNMSNPLVVILNSIWNLGPITQLLGSKKVGKKSRKSILTKTISIDTFGWLMMATIAFLFIKGIATNILPYLILTDLALIIAASGYGYPAWFSWMGDIVDSKFRGRWFSKRSTIISFTAITLAISASFAVQYAKSAGKEAQAFMILFIIAFLARFYSIFIIRRHYEPKIKLPKKRQITLKQFIKESKKTNLGKFTIFRSIFAMIISLTAPLTSIYLLRYLKFDYVSYMIIMLAGTIFSVLTLNMWGKIADKYGNYRVIALTTIIIPLTPILWILSQSKIYLFIVPAILGGTAWSAFMMASGNFIYDNTNKESRSQIISYFNLFLGAGAFLGGIISSILIETIHIKWIEPIYAIFIIGTLLRMVTVAAWIPHLKEIKKTKKLHGLKELKHVFIKEMKPTLIEDFHEIAAIPKYIKE